MSEHFDNVSHDVVSNFLKQSRITARQVWELVKGLIKNTEKVKATSLKKVTLPSTGRTA
ncbi:MAG: hypothetical protein Q7T96_16280 [Methylobacter sp.]|nr:hypothetical protein [Methylobacter sp.]